MDMKAYSLEELEVLIVDLQKKIFIGNANLKDETLAPEETLRLNEAMVNLKNQMFQFQTALQKKYSEEKKEVHKE